MKVHAAVIQRILDNCDFSVLDIMIFMFINNSFFSYGLLYYNYKFVYFYGVSCKENPYTDKTERWVILIVVFR